MRRRLVDLVVFQRRRARSRRRKEAAQLGESPPRMRPHRLRDSSASHQSSASSARAGSSSVEALDGAAEQIGGQREGRRRQRAPAGGGESRRPRARRARCPSASSGPSSRRSWCACSRCQPMVSSCSAALADLRFDPVGEARMQLGARALEQTAVGGVADQHVVEAQHRLAEEPAACRARSARCGAATRGARRARCHCDRSSAATRAAREVAADDGGALEHGALLGAQALDARRQQRVDRRRHLERGEAGAGDPAVSLALDGALLAPACAPARRRTAGCPRWSRAPWRRRRRAGRAAPMTLAASRMAAPASRPESVTTSATSPPRRHQRRAQRRAARAARRQDEQRHAAAPLHEVLDQIEQQRLGPVQVVDDQHHRLRLRERRSRRRTTKKVSSGDGGEPGEQRG